MPSFYLDPTLSMSNDEIARAQKAAQARANGAKSHRPTSAAGKAISSKNAIKHGFAASSPVAITIEERPAWEAHLSSYMDSFQPVNQPEADAVRRAALAIWKLDRITQVEAELFNLEYGYHEVMIDARLSPDIGNIQRMAVAFKESSGDKAFEHCRYAQSASREHDQAIRTFYFLESKRRQVAENPRIQNEPPKKPAPASKIVEIGSPTTPRTTTEAVVRTEKVADGVKIA